MLRTLGTPPISDLVGKRHRLRVVGYLLLEVGLESQENSQTL